MQKWLLQKEIGSIFSSGQNGRYYNNYEYGRNVYVGDATNMKWHGATTQNFFKNSTYQFMRNYNGYFGYEATTGSNHSRGVAVCGEGF